MSNLIAKKPFALVRVLFGDPENPQSRVHRIRRQVKFLANHRNRGDDGVAMVFGRDNFKFVCDLGYDARLLDEKPLVYGPPSGARRWTAWRHKPLAWRAALEEFEDIVALDWDIRPLMSIDQADLFKRLAAKSFFQANLLQYKRVKAAYRPKMPGTTQRGDIRKIPSAAFVYLRGADGKHATDRITAIMENNQRITEEQAMAIFIDRLYGGWKGVEHWWQHHEPFCCRLKPGREAVSGPQGRRPKEYWFKY